MGEVADKHSELYHYTNWDGLLGIYENQTLHATHIRHLNDESEFHQASQTMVTLLLPNVVKELNEISKRYPRIAERLTEQGGASTYADLLTNTFVESLYKTIGDDFYVVSFCGTPSDDYSKRNGILSQWRGYGDVQGFALVFDTHEMEALFQREALSFDYGPSYLGDAIYGSEHELFSSDFKPKFEQLSNFVLGHFRHLLLKEPMPDGQEALGAFCQCTTTLKHEGFKEEQEVRVVAGPTIHTEAYLKHAHEKGVTLRAEKPIKIKSRRGYPVPYLQLFGASIGKLPIKRIIIGPGRRKLEAASSVRKMCRSSSIQIDICETPFV